MQGASIAALVLVWMLLSIFHLEKAYRIGGISASGNAAAQKLHPMVNKKGR